MAYYSLEVCPKTPERVRRYLQDYYLDPQLREVHWMLSRDAEPESLAMYRVYMHAPATLLLVLTGGLSTIFYQHPNPNAGSGERYKRMLADYYPWDYEPVGGADATTGPSTLYKVFRNPLAHALGIPDRGSPGVGMLGMAFPEEELENLERSPCRVPLADRTLDLHADGGRQLNIIGLYWGLRFMVRRLTEDAAMMASVEARLP